MSTKAFIGFALVLWVAPAIVAGMLDWPGIWGGGSAFSDLIVPAPITGGIFHVPSYIVTLAIVRAYPTLTDRLAAFVRTAFAAAAIVGFLQIVDLERLYLSFATDMQASGFRLQRNYIGLCIMTDSIVAWVWLTIRRRAALPLVARVAVITLPAIAYAALQITGSQRLDEPFMGGRPDVTDVRGDSARWVFTRLSPADPAFREQALAFAKDMGPEYNINYQDMALYFSDSLHLAREFADGEPLVTLCLYEDGTPPAWHDGRGDCFSHHENFAERLDRIHAEQPADLPTDVRTWLVAREICSDVTVPEAYNENEEINFCRYGAPEDRYRKLLETYGEDRLAEMLNSE